MNQIVTLTSEQMSWVAFASGIHLRQSLPENPTCQDIPKDMVKLSKFFERDEDPVTLRDSGVIAFAKASLETALKSIDKDKEFADGFETALRKFDVETTV